MSHETKHTNNFPTGRNFFQDFFDADRFFAPGFLESINKSHPAVNIKESDRQFELELATPGFEKNDFKIEVENGILKVSAEKKEEKTEEKKNFTKKEFSFNSFERSFMLPETADENEIKAAYKHGILSLEISKKKDAPKKSKKAKISIS